MRGTEEISNSEDIIDSRDVIARIEYLEGQRETCLVCSNSSDDEAHNDIDEDGDHVFETSLDVDEEEELAALKDLADEGESATFEWSDGAALIRDSYFEDYARELADDIGAIDRDANWPVNCIDWEQAASELQQDYTSIDFDGVTYWVRS